MVRSASSARGVQGDAASLKSDVRRLVAALAEAHEEAAASVATLARIDAVKGRMQAAHDTLRVRTQSLVMDMDARMHACLDLLGSVAHACDVL